MPKLKRVTKLCAAVLLLCLSGLPVKARITCEMPPVTYTSPMGADFLRWNVEALCSPQFEGRASGDSAAFWCSAWIRRSFERAGLKPLGDSWFQSFELPSGGRGRNVVGCIPGTSGKWIVVGAYYDGLGTVGGRLYPGADANASGVAALISLAFNAPDRPRDGIIFAAFDGHAQNYCGARELLELLGKRNIRLMVNLDTMGSTLAPVERRHRRFLIALGGERYESALGTCARLPGLKLYYDYYRSDKFTRLFYRKIGEQRVFLEAGVPAVVFTSGVTLNTNKSTDTPETLDYEVLRARVLCISRWLSIISS